MKIHVSLQGQVVILQWEGRLDWPAVEALEQALKKHLLPGCHIHLNLEGLQAITSKLLGALVWLFKQVDDKKGQLTLSGVSPKALELITRAKIADKFNIFLDQETALLSHGQAAKGPLFTPVDQPKSMPTGTSSQPVGLEDIQAVPHYRVVTFVPTLTQDQKPNQGLDQIMAAVTNITPLQHRESDGIYWTSSAGVQHFRELSHEGLSHEGAGCYTIGDTNHHMAIRLEFSLPFDRTLLNRVINEAVRPHHPWPDPVIIITECWEA